MISRAAFEAMLERLDMFDLANVRNAVEAEFARREEKDPDVNKLSAAEEEMVKRGSKIEAIKSVRNRLGLGLKEAKDFVERLTSEWKPGRY